VADSYVLPRLGSVKVAKLRAIERRKHHDLEQVPGPVGTDDQPAVRILSDVFEASQCSRAWSISSSATPWRRAGRSASTFLAVRSPSGGPGSNDTCRSDRAFVGAQPLNSSPVPYWGHDRWVCNAKRRHNRHNGRKPLWLIDNDASVRDDWQRPEPVCRMGKRPHQVNGIAGVKSWVSMVAEVVTWARHI